MTDESHTARSLSVSWSDPRQLADAARSMLGIVLASHNHRRLLGDKEARKRSLTAFEQLIARHAAARRGAKSALKAVSR